MEELRKSQYLHVPPPRFLTALTMSGQSTQSDTSSRALVLAVMEPVFISCQPSAGLFPGAAASGSDGVPVNDVSDLVVRIMRSSVFLAISCKQGGWDSWERNGRSPTIGVKVRQSADMGVYREYAGTEGFRVTLVQVQFRYKVHERNNVIQQFGNWR